MRLYYFTTAEHGLAAIRDRRLKVSEIHKLNDPFEFLGPSIQSKEIRDKLKQLKQRASKKLGIICFSEDWQHPLMWSHYANKHQGICLGFEVNDLRLRKVNYSPERLDMSVDEFRNIDKNDRARAIFETLIATKFNGWEYEKEYRILRTHGTPDPVNELHFIDFSETLKLEAIIIGSEAKVSRIRVRQALGDLADHVSSFKARPAFKEFKVVENKLKSAWK